MTSHKFHKGQNSMRYSIPAAPGFKKTPERSSLWLLMGLFPIKYLGWEQPEECILPSPDTVGMVLVAASWCCLERRENNFTFKCRSLYWSFGMAKERNAMFIKNISINSFLNINCLSVSLGPIKYAEEPPQTWSSTAQNDIARVRAEVKTDIKLLLQF